MKGWEKIACGIGGVTFLAALVWGALTFTHTPEIPLAESAGEFDHELPPSGELSETAEWGKPSPQGGPDWIFDIFTPPVIYFNETTGTFAVTPPFQEETGMADDFELRLLGIRREPYRFQLVAYAGNPGQYVLTLENLETGKDVFCAPGEILAEHQIRVDGFMEARKVPSTLREGRTEVFDLVGQATVTDLRNDRTYVLRHSKIAYQDQPSGVFSDPEGTQIVLRKGQSWRSSLASYTLLGIHARDRQVTVEKSSLVGGDNFQKILQSPNDDNPSDLTIRHTTGSDSLPEVF